MAPTDSKKPWLVMMMKAPREGRVKTRLGAEIGIERATELYRRFVEYIIGRALAWPSGDWQTVIAYDPADAEPEIRQWVGPLLAPDTLFLPQRSGDLGQRMRRIFEQGFEAGAPSVLAIGADCLELTGEDLAECFVALEGAPLLIAEANDGGYWTIGMRGRHFEIFDDMPWSKPELAETTRKRARALGLRLAEGPMKTDVDTKADLDGLAPELRRSVGID